MKKKQVILVTIFSFLFCNFNETKAQTGCSTPPTLSSLILTNDCYAPSVNLTNLFNGTLPSNTTTLVWYTTSTHSGSAYATPAAATAGTYYDFFYDAAFNCFSSPSEPVQVTIVVCPCITAANNATIINADINGTSLSNGNFHITKNITIDGTVLFNKTDFLIESGVTITIAPTANVTFKFTHLHCCSGMWQGINVLTGGQIQFIQDVDFLSVIEDAIVAINYNFPNNFINTNPNYLLHINGTVFNRNETGIKISNLYANTAVSGQLPFYISGSIFTSRDIPFDYSVPWGYLGNRLDVAFSYTDATNSGVNGSRPPNTLAAPFFNNLPLFPCPDNTVGAFLKKGLRNEKPQFGISLDNLCEGESNFMSIGKSLFGTYANLNYNIFDNIDIGIDASSAKLVVYNSIFQKKHRSCPNGVGINLHDNGIIANPRITIQNIDDLGNPTSMQNSFYDLAAAIKIDNYSTINIRGCNIRSNQSRITASNPFGNAGIVVEGTAIPNLNLSFNKITNITSPIIYSDFGTGTTIQKNINISDNEILAALPSATPTNNEFISTAIALNGSSGFSGIAPDIAPLVCSRNVITGAYNGIIATDFVGKSLNIQLNNITLLQQPLKRNKIQEQFGIRLNNGSPAFSNLSAIRSVVQNNLVAGSSIGGAICTNCNQTGIYLSDNSLTDVNCNKAENLTHGFRFLNINSGTKFFDNNIEPTNLFGFTLDQNAIIGNQGFNRTGVKCNSDNSWKVPRTSWLSNYSVAHFMTLVRNAVPTSSKLYVHNTNTTNPDLGGASPNGLGSTYSTANGSIITQNPTFTTCTHCTHSSSNPNTDAAIAYEENVEILEEIAEGTIELIDDDPAARLYVLQQQLYEQLLASGNNYANSTTLQNFINNSGVGSFDYIYYVQQYLNDGNLDAVDLLLGYFPNNNQIEQNYLTYYSWMANMIDSPNYRPDTEEVFTMASLCPAKNGNVVYKARALYYKLTQTHDEVFSDECPLSIAARGVRPALQIEKPTINTNYMVYPNPVKDVFNINNKDLERFVITDIAGRVVMAQKCVGVQRETIDISSFQKGLYIIKLQKADGGFITKKLIKQ